MNIFLPRLSTGTTAKTSNGPCRYLIVVASRCKRVVCLLSLSVCLRVGYFRRMNKLRISALLPFDEVLIFDRFFDNAMPRISLHIMIDIYPRNRSRSTVAMRRVYSLSSTAFGRKSWLYANRCSFAQACGCTRLSAE